MKAVISQSREICFQWAAHIITAAQLTNRRRSFRTTKTARNTSFSPGILSKPQRKRLFAERHLMLTGLALPRDISTNSVTVGVEVILSICIRQASDSNAGQETDYAHLCEVM